MPLDPIGLMMRNAARGCYAIGYFESWSLESLQGVVDAAEQTRSPIILGFNGAFLAGARATPERLELYAGLGRASAESSSVPCGLIFNECPRDDWVLKAIAAGLLEEITRRVPVPLVLHGGTGITAESLRAAIALGVAKVNFGTYLKQGYLKTIRAALGHEAPPRPPSPARNGRTGRRAGGGPPRGARRGARVARVLRKG
jgi:fructose/tagatose bisphosphate aldolase